jgi:hypothetical protein
MDRAMESDPRYSRSIDRETASRRSLRTDDNLTIAATAAATAAIAAQRVAPLN